MNIIVHTQKNIKAAFRLDHLLDRDKKYFASTRISNVNKWNKNINSAIERGSGQLKKFWDIREYFVGPAERTTLNRVVVGSIPTLGEPKILFQYLVLFPSFRTHSTDTLINPAL